MFDKSLLQLWKYVKTLHSLAVLNIRCCRSFLENQCIHCVATDRVKSNFLNVVLFLSNRKMRMLKKQIIISRIDAPREHVTELWMCYTSYCVLSPCVWPVSKLRGSLLILLSAVTVLSYCWQTCLCSQFYKCSDQLVKHATVSSKDLSALIPIGGKVPVMSLITGEMKLPEQSEL